MNRRASGILCHITSLPSPFGIGDLGPGTHAFVDWLAAAGQRFWQVLPIAPTSGALGHSPYSGTSAFAGNPLLVSPELLADGGLLSQADLEARPAFSEDRVDFRLASEHKWWLLRRAFENWRERTVDPAFEVFCAREAHWLEDYALFSALRGHFGGAPWTEWPRGLRDREKGALAEAAAAHADEVLLHKFLQHKFFSQWWALARRCREAGAHLMGDIPIYVSHDGADCWANREIFKLDGAGRPTHVAGVPPDYFSETGQLWGNPVYRWDVLKERGFDWWLRRMAHMLRLHGVVRIDHFRGFVGYWEVPAGEVTAVNGEWMPAPAEDFFDTLSKRFLSPAIIAEDLGVITPDVREIMHRFGFPGMRVLLFAFGRGVAENPHAPHNVPENCLLYTGTHDNNTARGWLHEEATPDDLARLAFYTGCEVTEETVHVVLSRLAMMSTARTVVLPLQDVLGLPEAARMNMPSVTHGNWEWRVTGAQLAEEAPRRRLRDMTELYGRT